MRGTGSAEFPGEPGSAAAAALFRGAAGGAAGLGLPSSPPGAGSVLPAGRETRKLITITYKGKQFLGLCPLPPLSSGKQV